MTQHLNILVVDDDQDNALSLGELFELEGHSVRVVFSGEAAVEAYLHESFDVAFMDVMLPGKNGVDSFLEIRRMRPGAKVYMMTGYSVQELLQQAVRGGALGVLDKPFDGAEVLKLTEQVGPAGLVLASDTRSTGTTEVGAAICDALSAVGCAAALVREPSQVQQACSAQQVMVLDLDEPLTGGLMHYRSALAEGHRAPTILVPQGGRASTAFVPTLRDVSVTGILNKPFDPQHLLQALPILAA